MVVGDSPIEVILPVAVVPVRASKVMDAVWPTLSLVVSASVKSPSIWRCLVSTSSMNPDPDEDDEPDDDEDEEPDPPPDVPAPDDAEPEEPDPDEDDPDPPELPPTVPLTAVTVPANGALRTVPW